MRFLAKFAFYYFAVLRTREVMRSYSSSGRTGRTGRSACRAVAKIKVTNRSRKRLKIFEKFQRHLLPGIPRLKKFMFFLEISVRKHGIFELFSVFYAW